MASAGEVRLRVKPVYGWGWVRLPGTTIEVPPEFELHAVVEKQDADRSPVFAIGRLVALGHPLDGLWLRLSRRTAGEVPTFNVDAFDARPDPSPGALPPAAVFSGFAEVALPR